MRDSYPYYLAGEPVSSPLNMVVTDKYSGKPVCRVSRADKTAVENAIAAAVQAADPMRKLAAHKRQTILAHVAKRLQERQEELAQVMCIEAGKTIRDARGEVGRAIETFRIAAEESVRMQ